MNEKTEKIKAVFSDEEFVKTCLDAENEEAVQKLLADKGVEMSLDEIRLMAGMIGAVADGKVSGEQLEKLSETGELSDDDLAEAAGGVDLFNYFVAGKKVDVYVYNAWKNTGEASRSLTGTGWGVVLGGVVMAGTAAYGICKACGVDVAGGISTAYNWCKEKITSRW